MPKKLTKTPKNKYVLTELAAACQLNAEEHLGIAEMLYKEKFYAASLVHSIFAEEEYGKLLIVLDYRDALIPKKLYEAAFYKHGLKMAYRLKKYVSKSIITGEWLAASTAKMRLLATFVSKSSYDYPRMPSETINRKRAKIQLVHVSHIRDEVIAIDSMRYEDVDTQ